MQTYKNKGQSEVKIDTYDKEISRSSSKRSYNAMEETDITIYEGAMDLCGTKSKDSKQDGILIYVFVPCLFIACTFVVVKRSKADKFMSSNISSNGSSSTSVDLNLPLPDGKCCLIKVIY